MQDHFQVAVIGGGINGVGVAREAAARGYETLLVEKNDFGHATSGNSSKLIHGGIRYLEQGNFALVKEALKERKILSKIAPHLAKPLRFNIPVYRDSLRPWWMIWIGTRLYDWFAGKENLEPSSVLDLAECSKIKHLKKDELIRICQYSDIQTLDSRLTLETALSAKDYGASVHNYTELVNVKRENGIYLLELLEHRSNKIRQVESKVLVNAAGPWVSRLDALLPHPKPAPSLRYVRGIHFVIRGSIHNEGFLILPRDGRVIFVLPWCQNYTLIGTTETVYKENDFDHVPVSKEEEEYLFDTMKEFFPDLSLGEQDVLYKYSGVRSLIDGNASNSSSLSRESIITEDWDSLNSGYLAIFGGKLTTYRSMGVKIMDRIQKKHQPAGPRKANTEINPLPGGIPVPAAKALEMEQEAKKIGIETEQLEIWKFRYGSRWISVLDLALQNPELRETIGTPFYSKAEIAYSMRDEMGWELDDFILRRTKTCYELDSKGRAEVQRIIEEMR